MKNRTLLPTKLKHQNGSALLIALILVVVFTLVGVMTAERTKNNAAITGSNVRHKIVFEAAERTLRDAILFMSKIQIGSPIATADGSQGKEKVKNFTLSTIETEGRSLVDDPTTSFVWDAGALERRVCGANGNDASNCPAGINFIEQMDTNIWQNLAIQSKPANADVDANNYILNTETYTFIQRMKKPSSNGGFEQNGIITSQESSGETQYIITVKASGYPPGVTAAADNARENVILQSVYLQQTF